MTEDDALSKPRPSDLPRGRGDAQPWAGGELEAAGLETIETKKIYWRLTPFTDAWHRWQHMSHQAPR